MPGAASMTGSASSASANTGAESVGVESVGAVSLGAVSARAVLVGTAPPSAVSIPAVTSSAIERFIAFAHGM